MVPNYYGIRPPASGGPTATQQCTFVRETLGYWTDCPNAVGDVYDVAYGLNIWGLKAARGYLYTWSYTDIKWQIDQGRPMVGAWAWGFSGEGHMVVIKGYDTLGDSVWFNNPADQKDYLWTYSEFKSGNPRANSNNTWVATVANIAR